MLSYTVRVCYSRLLPWLSPPLPPNVWYLAVIGRGYAWSSSHPATGGRRR
jgi:hypothetical protein